MVGMEIFNVLTLFLQPLSICDAQQSCSSHQKYIFSFFLIVMDDKGNLTFVFLICINLWNRKSWLDNFMLLVTLRCAKKFKYEWEYTSEIFYS